MLFYAGLIIFSLRLTHRDTERQKDMCIYVKAKYAGKFDPIERRTKKGKKCENKSFISGGNFEETTKIKKQTHVN
jgi:hypothetical protein